MLGAIIGDIVGSRFEYNNIKTEDFELFHENCHITDDTVLTVATAYAILRGKSFHDAYKEFFLLYPNADYGEGFRNWAKKEGITPAYNSYGNGSAMRVSPVGWAYKTLEEVITWAKNSALVTHSDPHGIKGAQVVAAAIFLARNGCPKEEIKKYISVKFRYDLDFTLREIRPTYSYDVTCQGTVPPALIAFFESESFEDCIRKAVSLGGDCDTLTAIAGSIGEAFYGIPEEFKVKALSLLDERLKGVVKEFYTRATVASDR